MPPKEKGNLWLGFSAIFFSLAASSFFSSPLTPATGRWAWLHNILFNQFGSSGDFVFFLVAGLIGILIALKHYSVSVREKKLQ